MRIVNLVVLNRWWSLTQGSFNFIIRQLALNTIGDRVLQRIVHTAGAARYRGQGSLYSIFQTTTS
jgi:hypothetical protein